MSDYQNSESKLASEISNAVNSFSFKEKLFCEAMGFEHKTLQQSFTRLCFAWLRYCASDDYRYDGRNEASHVAAKKIKESGLLDQVLPMV